MKALVVEKPGTLSVRDVAEPPMGEYEARCEMLLRSYLYRYGSCRDRRTRRMGKLEYPLILGHERWQSC